MYRKRMTPRILLGLLFDAGFARAQRHDRLRQRADSALAKAAGPAPSNDFESASAVAWIAVLTVRGYYGC